MNNSIIQLKWVFHKQPISSNRLSFCVGVCNREMLLSPSAPTALRRDFPFLEIRIRAMLSLIEHRRTALSACVCDCAGVFLYMPAFCCICMYVKSMHISGSVYVRRRCYQWYSHCMRLYVMWACLNQSVQIRRESACLKILYVYVHTYSMARVPKYVWYNVCMKKTLCVDLCVCVCQSHGLGVCV